MSSQADNLKPQSILLACVAEFSLPKITTTNLTVIIMHTETPLWKPSSTRVSQSNLSKFCNLLKEQHTLDIDPSTTALYEWSIQENKQFWQILWDYLSITHSTPYSKVVHNHDKMPGAEWFVGAKLNFAENLLRFRDSSIAIISWEESSARCEISYQELYNQVTSLAAQLRALGIKPGDRVAACISNIPAAIIGMLASTAIGAIWSSCSPDFGVTGIVDRFSQIEAVALIANDGYLFKGRLIDCHEKIKEALSKLPTVKHYIRVPYPSSTPLTAVNNSSLNFNDLIKTPPPSFQFEQLPSQHPIYILFSSGTTGKPKCIVHGAIGTLIEQRKELELHSDLKRSDKIFYQTTCGWMMWNWLVSSLATGATLVLFDGSPLHEDNRILFRLAESEQVNIFGTNAKYLSLIEKSGIKPITEFKLEALQTILSTGSVLAPSSYDYVYQNIKEDLLLSSISGGTDILGCFALGNPCLPVHRGRLQTRSLGLAVEVFDQNGAAVKNKQGELVCTKPFPSMPLGFWNDQSGARYKSAYFERFKNVWTHGDYTELLENGEMIFHGRSDATLNPGGVRIGTAEIYQQVETLPSILEALVVPWRKNNDEQIVLFIVQKEDQPLSPELESSIKSLIRTNLSPFHVPHYIYSVPELPRTRSGKIVELAVQHILHGKAVENLGALANPECLVVFEVIAKGLNG